MRHMYLMKVSNKIMDFGNIIPSSLVDRCRTTWYYIPDDHNLDTVPGHAVQTINNILR